MVPLGTRGSPLTPGLLAPAHVAHSHENPTHNGLRAYKQPGAERDRLPRGKGIRPLAWPLAAPKPQLRFARTGLGVSFHPNKDHKVPRGHGSDLENPTPTDTHRGEGTPLRPRPPPPEQAVASLHPVLEHGRLSRLGTCPHVRTRPPAVPVPPGAWVREGGEAMLGACGSVEVGPTGRKGHIPSISIPHAGGGHRAGAGTAPTAPIANPILN